MSIIPRLQPGQHLTPVQDADLAIHIVYDNVNVPIDPSRIARVYNVPVFKTQYDLPHDVDGYLDWDEKGAFIVTSKDNSLEEQRFVVARELGYFHVTSRLGLPHVKSINFDLQEGKQNTAQAYAYEFALALLVPEQIVKKKFLLTQDVGMLSRVFQVPEQLMYVQLQELNLVA